VNADTADPDFQEGQVIEMRENRYEVDNVATAPFDGMVIHYELTPLGDAPPATLDPQDETLVLQEFHEVTPRVVDGSAEPEPTV